MAEAGDRTEKATPKRRTEARQKGQVARSPEVSPVVALMVALVMLSYGGPVIAVRGRTLVGEWLAAAGPLAAAHDGLGGALVPLATRSLMSMAVLVLPFVLVVAVATGGVTLAQVGWSVNWGPLAPDLSRLSPLNGIKRIFSVGGAVNLVKSVAKISLVLFVAYGVLREVDSQAVAAPTMSLDEILAFTGSSIQRLVLAMVFLLAVLAALDMIWQRYKYEKDLRMTKQEVKDEHKEVEGSPEVKGRFRKAQREVARRRMLSAVRDADVVLTNPIHVAVALRYRAEEMGAPQVVAKGAGEVAEKIKDAARRAGVPIVERRALARALFRSVKLGAEIPPALYRAVAEILAYIYSLRARGVAPEGSR